MKKKKHRFMNKYRDMSKSALLIFFILRTLVIVCMILQILNGNIENSFLCLLSLILLLIPSLIQQKLDITLPSTLEILIYLFIFAAEILGEINNFYGIIPIWDTILHTINGFLCAAIGFSLINLLNKNSYNVSLSPLYLCLVAFCFSMTIGILWEFFEYSADKVFRFDMQKDTIVDKISTVKFDHKHSNNLVEIDNISKTILYDENNKVLATIENGYLDIGINDTMKDLFVNFIGAFIFCIFGLIYLIKNQVNENSFIYNFIPIRGKKKNLDNAAIEI